MKKLSMILLCVLCLVGCTKAPTTEITQDREGNAVTLPDKIERILSTAPSNTEILIGLGVEEKIIGVDKYSSSLEGLNEDVISIDFRNPDVEAIIEMKPDILIASGHNKVGDEDPYALLKEAGITVVYLPTSVSIDGMKQDIEFIGSIVGKEDEAKAMTTQISEEVALIVEKAKAITTKKNVYFEISSDPLVSVGSETFLNEFIEIIQANNIMSSQKGWPKPSVEAILEMNPDVIITNQSYDSEAVSKIMNREGFQALNAVKNGEVYVIDSNLSSRCSQNAIEALKIMAELIYPEVYGK